MVPFISRIVALGWFCFKISEADPQSTFPAPGGLQVSTEPAGQGRGSAPAKGRGAALQLQELCCSQQHLQELPEDEKGISAPGNQPKSAQKSWLCNQNPAVKPGTCSELKTTETKGTKEFQGLNQVSTGEVHKKWNMWIFLLLTFAKASFSTKWKSSLC